MVSPIRILFVEDGLQQYRPVQRLLAAHGWADGLLRVTNLVDLQTALAAGDWNLVLSEYTAGSPQWDAACQMLRLGIDGRRWLILARSESQSPSASKPELGVHDYLLLDKPELWMATIARAVGTISNPIKNDQPKPSPNSPTTTSSDLEAAALSPLAVVDSAAKIVSTNLAWEGWTKVQAPANGFPIGLCGLGADYLAFLRSCPNEEAAPAHAGLEAVLAGQCPIFKLELRLEFPAGTRHFLFTITPLSLEQGGAVVGLADITEPRRHAQLQSVFSEVLNILSDPKSVPQATQRILEAIQRATGIEAVGIRLRHNRDFPYLVSAGFTSDFLRAENELAVRTPDKQFCLDAEGNIQLECTCGLVLSGKTDPANPLFTPGGSAWTNDSIPLLEVPLEQDPRLHPRNRCIHEGYHSVALIPIRVNGEVIGLLQLNDRRKGRFSREMIQQFESLAGSLGVALLRMKAAEAEQANQRLLRSVVDAIPESVILIDLDGTIVAGNLGFCTRFNLGQEACLGQNLFHLLPASWSENWRTRIHQVVATRQPAISEECWGERWLRNHFCPSFGALDQVERIVVLGVDITERKLAEEQLRASEARYRALLEDSPIAMGFVKHDGVITFLNRRFTQLLGYGLDDLATLEDWWRLAYPDEAYRSQVVAAWMAAHQHLDTAVSPPREWIVACRTGPPRTVQISSIKLAGGTLVGFIDLTERKQAEEAIRHQNSLIKCLLNSIPDLIFFKDIQGKYLGCNHAFSEFTGVSAEQIVGRTDFELFQPEIAGSLQQYDLQALNLNAPQQKEKWVLYPDGRRRLLETLKTPYRGPHGELLGVLGLSRDITERKSLENEREAALAKYQTLFNSFPLGITVTDQAGQIVETNSHAKSLLGITEEEHNGRSISSPQWKIIRPDGSPMPPEEFASVRAFQGKCLVENVEMGVIRPDGKTVWLNVTAVPLELPGYGVVITYSDISESKQAKEALAASEERFRIYVDQAADALFVHDIDGRFLVVNQRALDSLGYSREEFMRLKVTDVEEEFDLASAQAIWRQIEPGKPFTLMGRQRRKDGSVFPVEIRFGCFDLAGVRHFLALVRDITERCQREELDRRHLHTLELLAADKPLEAVLESVLQVLECVRESWRGSIMLPDATGTWLYCAAAPRLPDFYREALRQVPIKVGEGACGTAAATCQLVISEDIATHPYWENYREVSARAGLRACWSIPILSAQGEFLGGLAVYHDHPCGPTAEELKSFEGVKELAGIAIGKLRAENALRQREEIFSNIVAQAADAIAVVDCKTTRFVEFNSAAHEGLGYSREEFSGFCIAQIQAEHGQTTIERNLADIKQRGSLTFETQHRHRNGHLREVRVSIRQLHIQHRDFAAAVWTDITEHKRAEARAASDTQRIQFLLELHHRAPQMTDVELFDKVLEQAVSLTRSQLGFGYHISEDQQRVQLISWIPKPTEPRSEFAYSLPAVSQWLECLRSRRPAMNNDHYALPGGPGLEGMQEPIQRLLSVPMLREGQVKVVIGVGNKSLAYDEDDLAQIQMLANDLHKIVWQRLAQNQLRQSELRFRHLVETTFDWIWEVDTETRYTYCSPKVIELLGYTPEEVIGRTPFDLMAPEEAQRVAAVFAEIVRKREPFSSLENTNRHKNGRSVILETSGVPVWGESGEWLGYRGMDHDVTERKRLESQLRQAQKLEAVGQLAGGIAHDFNNILAAIEMQLSLLKMRRDLDREVKSGLEDLHDEARRAATLTRQLLMFSRRSVLTIKAIDLGEVIENLLKMLRRLIGENVRLDFEVIKPLPLVEADAGMMEQVVMNLAVNARDAMPQGGRISILVRSVEFGPADQAKDSNHQPGKYVCLSVADTGCGMDETTKKRMFEPFFTTKEPGKGTGLGLATVHGIVAQHKGWVEVESQPGNGAKFQVYLPAKSMPAPVETNHAPVVPIQGGREGILLVEDEDILRRTVAKMLTALGYQVLEAENGQKAMLLWQEHGSQVDLLLTDMIMPEGMTGLELAKRLQEAKSSLKVIICSGYSAEVVHSGGIMAAGICFIAKPYEAADLTELIRRMLDPKQA